MMRINGVMNNYSISYKAKMDKSNSVLSEKTSNVEVNNKDLEKQAINTLLFSVSKPLGILSMLNNHKKIGMSVAVNNPQSSKIEDLKSLDNAETKIDKNPSVAELGAIFDEHGVVNIPDVFVNEAKASNSVDDLINSCDIEVKKDSAINKEEEIPPSERQEMIEILKKKIDCLSAEEAYGINKYYKDCDCSVINTDVRANKKGFFLVVDLVDEKIRNDKELKEQIIQELKLQQFREMSARLGLQKEPTPELLALEIVDLNAVNKELLSRATIYERTIGIPENAKILEKIFEPWYINYIKLCKQLGISARECGVKGGAFDHYLQLQQRQNTETYPEYVKLLEYRAGYDENAFHDYVNLSVDDDKLAPAMGEMLHDLASSNNKELYSLKEVIDLIKQAPKTNWKVLDLLQALKDKEITFDNFTSKLRVIKQEIKAEEEESVREKLDIDTIYQENHNYDYNDNTQYVFA